MAQTAGIVTLLLEEFSGSISPPTNLLSNKLVGGILSNFGMEFFIRDKKMLIPMQ